MSRPSAPPPLAGHSLWHRLDTALAALRRHREPLSLIIDAATVALAWQVTYLFRLGFERWISARPAYDHWVLGATVASYMAVFALLRIPRCMWRFAGFGDIQRLALACLGCGLLVAFVVAGVLQLEKVPRAVLALHPLVTLMGVCSMRLAYRMLYEHMRSRLHPHEQEPRRALVLGAGEAAKRLLAGIQGQGWRVLGLLDDDPAKRGLMINGVPVLGGIGSLQTAAQEQAATHLILALPSISRTRRREIIEQAAQARLPLLTVPTADELNALAPEAHTALSASSAPSSLSPPAGGSGAAVQAGAVVPPQAVRDIQPEDLLGRDPVELDEAGIAESLQGKTVLVTGAGGSIGAELCLQVARFGPARLVLLELSEYALYRIEQQLSERHPALATTALMADVKDMAHMRALLQAHRPQVVFHAAAFKHVPLMEVGNALAALRNNTIGTWHTALAAAEVQVERFVLISTDKAVNPTNVMGATKRAAETLVMSLSRRFPATRFMAVRFGNVLGSSGSVIPRFKEQIARGGPVTVTHPEVIRYFMTVREACRLVLQAAAIGESGQVLVLDMGEPVKIVDLARSMIRMSGHALEDIAIVYTGLRPGEKLYEELLADQESSLPTSVDCLRVARLQEGFDIEFLLKWLEECSELARQVSVDDQAVRLHLQRIVPEYAIWQNAGHAG